jgi:hypoxanthine-DNA glycosylase
VLKTCFRSGSLDSQIDDRNIVTNDFQRFFANHPDISRIFFNGAKAESLYLKHVLPGLEAAAAAIKRQRLPSTSPAHASLSLEQKKEAWRVIE